MKGSLYTILLIITSNLTFGQTDYSTHTIDFYLNNKEKQINVSEIWIIVEGTKIFGEKIGESFRFPIIDSNVEFEFGIKTNRMEFESGPYNAWFLNSGSRITVGKINRINKLLSVAHYSEMNKSEISYNIFAKRFFIGGGDTIDIDNYENVKRLDYLIINPNQQCNGGYVTTQKIIKLKS